jgi:tRNA pseudouridine55 synthase
MLKSHYNFVEGEMLLIDKPLEWTSFDAVNKIRYAILRKLGLKKIKVGHAGTLDPLATGLLIICTGKFTKRIDEFQEQDKEYTGTLYLGATTPSFDKETEVDREFPTNHITEELIVKVSQKFIGETMQVPPVFSAVKIGGERAYNKARKNQVVKIQPKKITISEFEIVKISMPEISFRVKCGKGTYIRALARDFGQSLNSGAYLSSLRRTRIGEFNVENAISISDMVKVINELPGNTVNIN